MFSGNFANYFVGDTGALAQAGEMELAHFSAAAHIVHQIIRISSPADESHDLTSSRFSPA
jgi:hypothetical protein